MLELWVIYADDPGAPIFKSVRMDAADPNGAFEQAAKDKLINGRPIRSMWTIDPASEQGAAIKVYGDAPPAPTMPSTIWRS